MHGTIIMFLFAVPAVEALGVLLLPNMQAARDLPFPRLSAYAFGAYSVGPPDHGGESAFNSRSLRARANADAPQTRVGTPS
jgi:hypothetical protein